MQRKLFRRCSLTWSRPQQQRMSHQPKNNAQPQTDSLTGKMMRPLLQRQVRSMTKLLIISAPGSLITQTQTECLNGGSSTKSASKRSQSWHVSYSVSPHRVRLQSGPLVSVGASWKRDARDWDRSRSAIFSSSIAILESDSVC